MSRYTPPTRTNDAHVDRMAELVDNLNEFDQFREEVLPELRKMLAEKASPSEMRRKFMHFLTARLITEGLTNPDATKAIAAIKEVFDREEGKATEKKEVSHRLGRLPEKELDAILLSEIDDMKVDEDDGQEG